MRGSANASAVNTITPKPRLILFPTAASKLATLRLERQGFNISTADQNQQGNAVLRDAMSRYETLLFVGNQVRDDCAASMPTLQKQAVSSLSVHVADGAAELKQGVSEAYNLSISAERGLQLSADTTWGALRGLETMAQIVIEGRDGGFYADAQEVRDAPQYEYRGLMIDTARHYLSVDTILQVIEGMAVEKLNLLHWHAADDQSFPMEVKPLPKLAKKGAFGKGLWYTAENVTRVVAFGKSRGVQVKNI